MNTYFSEQLWINFDLEVAVYLENLAGWLFTNASEDNETHRNFHEGRYWSNDSYTELSKRFQGWSVKTIRTIISRCVKYGLIIISNFNKKKYDNTNWYTLTDKALEYFPMLRGLTLSTAAQTGRPIPEDLNSQSFNTTVAVQYDVQRGII